MDLVIIYITDDDMKILNDSEVSGSRHLECIVERITSQRSRFYNDCDFYIALNLCQGAS